MKFVASRYLQTQTPLQESNENKRNATKKPKKETMVKKPIPLHSVGNENQTNLVTIEKQTSKVEKVTDDQVLLLEARLAQILYISNQIKGNFEPFAQAATKEMQEKRAQVDHIVSLIQRYKISMLKLHFYQQVKLQQQRV
jgi:hypothetical protein